MNVEQLTELAERFLEETYGLSLDIPIEINGRLRRSLGRYCTTIDYEPLRIEIARYLIEYGTEFAILDTLKHELVHYAMHLLGRPFDDGHPEFEAELRRLGIHSTNTLAVGKRYIMKCDECGEVSETGIISHIKKPQHYRTKCCKSSYTYIGDAIYDGESRQEVLFDTEAVQLNL